MRHLETSILFIPGRASYLDNNDVLQLSAASQHRADTAAAVFNPNYHQRAVFVGGFPGLAQGWSKDLTPPADRREATLMSRPLRSKLTALSPEWGAEYADKVIKTQGTSSDSFGDVIDAVSNRLITPEEFNANRNLGILLVAGALHGAQFRIMLSKALDINPRRIVRHPMWDIYGSPATPRRAAESRPKAIANGLAAVAVTKYLMRNVAYRDLRGMREAHDKYKNIASKRAA